MLRRVVCVLGEITGELVRDSSRVPLCLSGFILLDSALSPPVVCVRVCASGLFLLSGLLFLWVALYSTCRQGWDQKDLGARGTLHYYYYYNYRCYYHTPGSTPFVRCFVERSLLICPSLFPPLAVESKGEVESEACLSLCLCLHVLILYST